MIPYEQYTAAADYLRNRLLGPAETAIVLGSGLGSFTEKITNRECIPYTEIPGFPQSTVMSHAGMLISGTLRGKRILVMSGRFHYYEGYSPETIAFYVRVLKLSGVHKLILTNAAGGVNQSFSPGDLMLITDHINFLSESPVRGPHQPEFGERFFDMSNTYSKRLRRIAGECAGKLGFALQEGVYFYMPGPEFETPAEIRAIRTLGADAVGMSTVPEAVTARQCGMEVLGISCITNMAAGIVANSVVSGEEVIENAAKASGRFQSLLADILEQA